MSLRMFKYSENEHKISTSCQTKVQTKIIVGILHSTTSIHAVIIPCYLDILQWARTVNQICYSDTDWQDTINKISRFYFIILFS